MFFLSCFYPHTKSGVVSGPDAVRCVIVSDAVIRHTDIFIIIFEQYYATRSDYVDDILKYWSDQASSKNLPTLCRLAELYLGMASSSVPVECLFSSAALVANGKRSSLTPYKLEQILFVHDNFELARDSLLT